MKAVALCPELPPAIVARSPDSRWVPAKRGPPLGWLPLFPLFFTVIQD